MSDETLGQVFNHIVFPPKLPGQQDASPENVRENLTNRIIDATLILKNNSTAEFLPAWSLIEDSLNTFRQINDAGFVNQVELLDAFKLLQPHHAIILHIVDQNAGVLIRDDTPNVIFEAFEASAMAEKVLESQAALQWDFPGATVSIPRSEFENTSFQNSLALFLEKASIETLDEFAAKSQKAGATILETRDTTDPALITQFLMTLLETSGSRIYPSILRKRIKDDVCWDNADLPWRRSPHWLVLRVSVQRLLYLTLGDEIGRAQYKFLICALLARLLNDSANYLSTELCHFLKAKLCRRLAKLEVDRESSDPRARHVYSHLFGTIGTLCQESIETATAAIKAQWRAFRTNIRRKIPNLPPSANEEDLHLTLPNCASYLQNVLNQYPPKKEPPKIVDEASFTPKIEKDTTETLEKFLNIYFSLADTELSIELQDRDVPTSRNACDHLCMNLANQSKTYSKAVGNAYDENPEQLSVFILNIFDLWVRMDKCATVLYPLLKEYHPCFHPKIFDVLLLSSFEDMKRLQYIQLYLHQRCTAAQHGNMTILDDPEPGCFVDRYFDQDDAAGLHTLQQHIEAASLASRMKKEKELANVNAMFKDLTRMKHESVCTQRRNEDGSHNIKGCSHCYYIRQRRRLKISIHEDFLPSEKSERNRAKRRAILFELGIPKTFASYRKVTWDILHRLCSKAIFSTTEAPKMLLSKYINLKSFSTNNSNGELSLASSTKSYLGTHYNWRKLPAATSSVLLPFGMAFSYYDLVLKVWIKDLPRPISLVHHFEIRLPKHLPFSNLYSSSAFAPNGLGPTSYETIASMNECPSQVSIHEFMAHQNLMSGRHRRWLSILAELGSSNLNFSLQDTSVLFHHLALQAGPRVDADVFRAVHVVFRDNSFCSRLIQEIDKHVEAVSANWRESNYMETLLTLAIRVRTLCPQQMQSPANLLLMKIRRVTFTWVTLLREEAIEAEEADVAEQAARYGFLAALLCRRTFVLQAYGNIALDAESFECFIGVTLTMQENLVELGKFSTLTRNLLVRDIKMTFRIKTMLRQSVLLYPESLESALKMVWPEAEKGSRAFTEWRFLPKAHEWWVTASVKPIRYMKPQVIHLHLLQGHLIVDGKSLGKLPADIRDSAILKELFGNQRLRALPSNIPGMSYVLEGRKNNYQIHLGYRPQGLVMQATSLTTTLEHIPRHVFGSDSNFDLPDSLVSNCIHWLDLNSGVLEIRRMPSVWKSRPGDWNLNFWDRKAYRRTVSLIDPHSKLFKTVAQVFKDFELPQMLTIYQPRSFPLSVELKRMNLDFHVNKCGLLQCKQLSSEIDSNQDAGVLYGLQSMLVLRDTRNRSQRSIIATHGKVNIQRLGPHVSVQLENTGSYLRYTIDDVLGRLHCLPEPRILYNKAQLHAFTSFVLPDPLTGRTGTEEALHCLQSGYCQPWCPLSQDIMDILRRLSELTPKRLYYPKNLKCQQVTAWNPHLTIFIQHDAYQPVIDAIFKKSERLLPFYGEGSGSVLTSSLPFDHLRDRSQWRRSLYECSDILHTKQISMPNSHYHSRDRWVTCKRTLNVREIATLLRSQPSFVCGTLDLAKILERRPAIGGFVNEFMPHLIQDCLNVNIAEEWGSLVNLCRNCELNDFHRLAFHLALIAFREDVDIRILRTLIAFFLLDDLKKLDCPSYASFTGFQMNEQPSSDVLTKLVRPYYKQYLRPVTPKRVSKRAGTNHLDCVLEEHEKKCHYESEYFVMFLIDQWPTPVPFTTGFQSSYLEIENSLEAVRPEWDRLYENLQLSEHISQVQAILDRFYRKDLSRPYVPPAQSRIYFEVQMRQVTGTPRLADDLLCRIGPKHDEDSDFMCIDPSAYFEAQHWVRSFPRAVFPDSEVRELERIIKVFTNSTCSVNSSYGRDLEESIAALKTKKTEEHKEPQNIHFDTLIRNARDLVRRYYIEICIALSALDERYRWFHLGNLWPRITPITILERLRSNSQHNFGQNMKDSFIIYAKAINKLQRLLRMKDALVRNDRERLIQEYNNPGHINWNPSAFPDWLLLEIDANMQIREEQVTVALEMVSPTSDANSVLQMNMGQGKTSVIMPMAACLLADSKILARLLVPKTLLSQAAQTLQSRLGGLLGREITHIPFSRQTQTITKVIEEYQQLHNNALQNSGIILGVPEHIMSFQLSGLQRLSDGKVGEAMKMMAVQSQMEISCRDILDECDFTLAVKTQLIYPSGSQLAVDGHPYRWKVIQIVLHLVTHHLPRLKEGFPHSIGVVKRSMTGFPVVYLLRNDVGEALVQNIVDDASDGRISLLPIHKCTAKQQQAIKTFLSQKTVDPWVAKCISETFLDSLPTRQTIYLLRGLLVHGVLLLCLKKRWNVQYGLHPKRDPVAVPFHAKGVPSEQAEWGHPDVAILFTCLSFYYQGLNHNQLKQSLQAVLKSHDPVSEYDRWIQASPTLPDELRHWNLINVDDDKQIEEIWSKLRFTIVVINHFLNNCVFPTHARQFTVKLQSSGWDIPLFPSEKSRDKLSEAALRRRPGITTGFSGTNDNRRLLPLTIKQHDLPSLTHINAEVLTYLLQKRNRAYMLAIKQNSTRFSEIDLLQHLNDKKIRILIDAGAFILEMDNKTLVTKWLDIDYEAQAAVFFGYDNTARVLYKNGKCIPLLATPFADNLESCLVYLDEAHTRGTDLKLPRTARGALTLGLNQTKDHTVQAAMRLRQLGTTQSITFIVPPEVHQCILDTCKHHSGDILDSSHIVMWLLNQTCVYNQELQSLYLAQGRDFCERKRAAAEFGDLFTNPAHRKAFLKALQQPEQQTLEHLYGPKVQNNGNSLMKLGGIKLDSSIREIIQELQRQQRESIADHTPSFYSALEEVEQEREVAYQIEEEREVQRPPRMSALSFPGLHSSILRFAENGILELSGAYRRASTLLNSTQLGMKYEIDANTLLPHLYASNEFFRTVKLKDGDKNDTFTRSANWILWSTRSETAIVIIPEEAEALIPILRRSSPPHVHLIIYAAPITKRMMNFNKLNYYALPNLPTNWIPPSWLPLELGLLAGRLYFQYPDYRILQDHLRLGQERNQDGESDTAVDRPSRTPHIPDKKTLDFLQEWATLRRQGQDLTHTPMGYVCQGWEIRNDHPFFAE
ncbi:hypothetical protein LOZ65_001413 [Ophidiomyces ophidiicola]|nr:hypothetical protein LOZ65_001413 [Ophidiomyces ophidiicola]